MVGSPYGAVGAGYGGAGFTQVRCFYPLSKTSELCLLSGNSCLKKVLKVFSKGSTFTYKLL
jgi:hypothetical protein